MSNDDLLLIHRQAMESMPDQIKSPVGFFSHSKNHYLTSLHLEDGILTIDVNLLLGGEISVSLNRNTFDPIILDNIGTSSRLISCLWSNSWYNACNSINPN